MKFNNEEISDITGREFLSYFKSKYSNFKILSLSFGVEFYFNEDRDEALGTPLEMEKIVHINCSSTFDGSDDFSMDFRGFSGKNFDECFKKFKVYYEGLYKVYLIEKKNSKE